jgi:hypothetical protein
MIFMQNRNIQHYLKTDDSLLGINIYSKCYHIQTIFDILEHSAVFESNVK